MIAVHVERICRVLKVALVILLLSTKGSAQVAQAWVFNRPFSFSSRAIVIDEEGNAHEAGCSGAAKYTEDGGVAWTAADLCASDIVLDRAGGVFVAGTLWNDLNQRFFETVKYNATGNRLWTARLGPGGAVATKLDRDGNLVVLGDARGEEGPSQYATVKYDSEGNELWRTYHGASGFEFLANALAVDLSGSVYVTGSPYSLVKYDASGKRIWIAEDDFFDPGWLGAGSALSLDGDGNILVAVSSPYCSGRKHYPLHTVKYDPDGNKLWDMPFLGGEGCGNSATGLAVNRSGEVYVTGNNAGPVLGPVGGCLNGAPFILKYSATGDLLWSIPVNVEAWGLLVGTMVLDEGGNAFIATPCYGESYGTVAKYDRDGARLWTAQTASGATALALDSAGGICVGGNSSFTKFVPTQYRSIFLRGDCDGDGQASGSVSDALVLLLYNFAGGSEPLCFAACDADGDGQVVGRVTDAVYLLNNSFLSGPPPVPPYPFCAPAPVSDSDQILGCEKTPDCL